MERIRVKGGTPLKGKVAVSGAKNSCLPLLFSSLLAEGEHVFYNVPRLRDVDSACLLLESLGCQTFRENEVLKVRVPSHLKVLAEYDLVRKMRASILCLGPLLARFGEAQVSMPGGCAIGSRPIGLHLDALESMGAQIEIKKGYVCAKGEHLHGEKFLFEKVSVGGTENIMMAATLVEGITILENAAKEPEIVDLAEYLKKMGAKISGAGTSTIVIEGVNKLTPSEHRVIPDRIEAGTLLIAGAITGGEVQVLNCVPEHIRSLLDKLEESGFELFEETQSVSIVSPSEWRPVDITTEPYPGFPTDLQAQFMALMTQAEGTSVITENVFENRFMHVQELVRLGADITPKGRVAVVRGKKGGLVGAPVMATDLRASASLVLAGLVASDETVINRIYHLDRGYEQLENKLSLLGAQVKRESY
ncbi:MAG: UDP-N-acetylglucosamine 1-carboxyvinyltransferase [Bdellovibrio sp.]|nr:MAG: UDP-N-acetylglucosamine 1-carboxyvinyltransferase [Bdellovibrio sp.]